MTALLIGADRLGNIPNTLMEYGIRDYIHWTGRKKGMRNFEIPTETDMIIVFYDFIEHNITKIVKEKAKQNNIPCVFSRRACSDLVKQLNNCSGCKLCSLQS
ncbi:DUF2325 domain-containing protein [Clostridium formicaceticum]|uniref:Dihydroorotate dehydrogenase n=1 Tax=Clostridium formicaceticum TaxID=1497 RepID=A0AAC9RHP1_9CLOT|nr:DUF2325 domain-containing protein [Clostridium formicaceticum]AOY75902.1 hypothetical protein BJL90_08350 [Clostridium formicaceticum]ARE86246.1 hypothetical protein CLFO_05680 [Clostridium formicaceticum]